MNVDVDEVVELARNIEVASVQSERVSGAVVEAQARNVVALAQQFAPVDTGELRASIGYEVNGLEALIGPTVEHGPAQEFGTAYVPPQPYMGPAAGIAGRRFVRDLAVAGSGLALGSPGGLSQLLSRLADLAGSDQGVE